MSDAPPSLIDNPAARAMVVGSVSYEGPKSFADGIGWLLASPDLRRGEERYGVELRLEKAGNAGVTELVLFVGKGEDGEDGSAFAILVAPRSRQGR